MTGPSRTGSGDATSSEFERIRRHHSGSAKGVQAVSCVASDAASRHGISSESTAWQLLNRLPERELAMVSGRGRDGSFRKVGFEDAQRLSNTVAPSTKAVSVS